MHLACPSASVRYTHTQPYFTFTCVSESTHGVVLASSPLIRRTVRAYILIRLLIDFSQSNRETSLACKCLVLSLLACRDIVKHTHTHTEGEYREMISSQRAATIKPLLTPLPLPPKEHSSQLVRTGGSEIRVQLSGYNRCLKVSSHQ